METIKLSQVSLYKIKVPNWEETKEKLLKLVPEDTLTQEGEGTWSDYPNTVERRRHTGNHPYEHKFFEAIDFEPHKVFGGSEGDYRCSDLWCMKYGLQGKIHLHDHNHGMSGILYTAYDPKHHCGTTFISPVRQIWDNYLVSYSPEVEEGDLILFPSRLQHYMPFPVYARTVPRIVFSFNIRTTKYIG